MSSRIEITRFQEELSMYLHELVCDNVTYADLAHILGVSERTAYAYTERINYNNNLKAYQLAYLPPDIFGAMIRFMIDKHNQVYKLEKTHKLTGSLDNIWIEICELFVQVYKKFHKSAKYDFKLEDEVIKSIHKMFAEWKAKGESYGKFI